MTSSQNQKLGSDVCVVGTGALGLLALKNLREQGLDARALERHEHIGGTWHASQNVEQTTATEYTTANTSKQCVRFKSVLTWIAMLIIYSVLSQTFLCPMVS